MSLFGKKETMETGVASEGKPRNRGGHRYGITEATLLMRTLPVDQNVELVVRVVRNTLESMNVQLAEIIDDAAAKEQGLQSRMETLNGEIAELSRHIHARRQEIDHLSEELAETTTVKERLLLAQKLVDRPATAQSLPPLPAERPTRPAASVAA